MTDIQRARFASADSSGGRCGSQREVPRPPVFGRSGGQLEVDRDFRFDPAGRGLRLTHRSE